MDQFNQIYNNHKQLISMAIRKCRIYKNVDHYEQVGMEALWKAYQQYTGAEENFAPYAYLFIRNDILNELRKMARVDARTVLLTEDETIESFVKNEKVQDLRDDVQQLLEPLKEEDRRLLKALYGDLYTYEEVATALGISVHSVKKRRDRIMKKLRLQKQHLFNPKN